MTDKDLQELLNRYQAGTATDNDKALLEDWYLHHNRDSRFAITDTERTGDVNLAWANIQANITKPKVRLLWPRIAAAASIVLALSFGGYFLLKKQDKQFNTIANDIKPGGNKAILILADGKQVVLTDAKNGRIAQQGSATINKNAEGLVAYNTGTSSSSAPVYNTMLTPRGGQYHLILADGTNVWLNAASSIKYPTAFTGADRTVEITGEAYFEVAHNKAKPFKVKSSGQTVTVLGTHFDVNAYNDEQAVKTTLLEGSVKVNTASAETIIKPGEQAILAQNKLNVTATDTEDAIAWKNGMFRFNEENLESIMRKVSRWYNVDIEYADEDIKDIPLTGIITHFNNVSKVLRMLELTHKVHFKIQGNKIIVMRT
jgi:transmembrane sensor